MIEIPNDLGDDYLILPLPFGKRCLVMTKNNTTSSRDKNGVILHNSFNSYLPNREIKGKLICLFDCIFNEE